ncbi:MAG TPA: four-carbon acid sugar kinase family protein [Tepidisphaeraceae bacterium]
MSDLLISFYGDDFTGSTDAMESLARCGIRTVLFTDPPTPGQLKRYPGIRAFGVAGMTRSMAPDEMEKVLRPALRSLHESGAPIVHYKVCSTFDSSPTVGSIGRVIDVGMDIFGAKFVPVLVAAPSLGRYCVFGNLFARSGTESEPYRLDRHPSMRQHPITPMDESDLRVHLAKQTQKRIGLLDIVQMEGDPDDAAEQLDALVRCGGNEVMLIDLLYNHQLDTAGWLLARHGSRDNPLFVVGSSGVEAALTAYWQLTPAGFPSPGDAGPIIALCGSCSPVTAGQIKWAASNGFDQFALNVAQLDNDNAVERSARSIKAGRSVVIHTSGAGATRSVGADALGPKLGAILRDILKETKVRRVAVAGGDTSGHVARALGIESMEMIAELTRGSPLCLVAAPGSPADGIEMTFKGGQIGKQDFFGLVEKGA